MYIFYIRKDSVLITIDGDSLSIPQMGEEGLEKFHSRFSDFVGVFENISCYAVEAGEDFHLDDNCRFERIRSLYGSIPDGLFHLAGKASHLIYWSGNNLFCGRCGNPTENSRDERAKICTRCGNVIYPRLNPAIIVAIIRGDSILLARANRPGFTFHSVLAGFVEPGESLEECVQREIMEEVGIRVKNIRYFGSQDWPFPDSLMVGFTAEYDSGEIQIDHKEIAEAEWFTKKNLPDVPGKLSIARKLIDWFVDTH
jgi:NAD+ diphosphatase